MLLKVNQEKSHVSLVTSSRTKFLGYGFYFSRAKGEVRLTIHKRANKAQGHDQTTTHPEPKNEHRECETAASAEASGVDELLPISRRSRWTQGWIGGYDVASANSLWKTWKKVKTRIRALVKLGADAKFKLITRIVPGRLLADIQQPHSHDHSDHGLPQTEGWSWLGCFRG